MSEAVQSAMERPTPYSTTTSTSFAPQQAETAAESEPTSAKTETQRDETEGEQLKAYTSWFTFRCEDIPEPAGGAPTSALCASCASCASCLGSVGFSWPWLDFNVKGTQSTKPRAMGTYMITSHGWNHMEGKKEFAEEERRCHFCQIRAFAIAQKPHCYTLAITNDVDDEWISLDFRFIEKCVLGQGVKESLAPHGYRVGCECKRDEDCATQCLCLDDLDPDNIINPKYKNAYYTAGERKGLLRYEILELSSDEIYECSDLCGCSMDCPNRVVGRGRKFNIEIFKTKDGRGFGMSVYRFSFSCGYSNVSYRCSCQRRHQERPIY
jgi:hypothetical protein